METRSKPVELAVLRFTPEGIVKGKKVFVEYDKDIALDHYEIEYGVNAKGVKETVYSYTPYEYHYVQCTILHEVKRYESGVSLEDFADSKFSKMLKRLQSPEVQDPQEFCPLVISLFLDTEKDKRVAVGSFWYDTHGALRKGVFTPPAMKNKVSLFEGKSKTPEVTIIGNGRQPLSLQFNEEHANKQVKGKNFFIEKLDEGVNRTYNFALNENYNFMFSTLSDYFSNPTIMFIVRSVNKNPSQELIYKVPLTFTYDHAALKEDKQVSLQKLPLQLFQLVPMNLTPEN